MYILIHTYIYNTIYICISGSKSIRVHRGKGSVSVVSFQVGAERFALSGIATGLGCVGLPAKMSYRIYLCGGYIYSDLKVDGSES